MSCMGCGMWLMQLGELGCWIIGWSDSAVAVYFVIVWLVCTRVSMMCNWLIARCGCGVLIVSSLCGRGG